MPVTPDTGHATRVIDTPLGSLRGANRPLADGRFATSFLGIPFAQAPVGDLRFAAPVPVGPWEGIFDALAFGPTPQRGDPGVTLIPEPSVPGDSTLNLNVTTPAAGDTDAHLPVLVWIHGGGFFAGCPASPWYNSTGFARDGVVTVVISYRLGFDGFGHIPGVPENRGVRDWLCALEWVRDNIASFGGDPSRVTIAGQSAGGGAVLTLLGMPAAHGLFHGAISLSGALADVGLPRAKELTESIAKGAGVSADRTGFASVPEERIIELQQKNTSLTAKGALQKMLDEGLALGPVVDGELIPHPTTEALAAGVGADIPLWLSSADDEFAMAFTKAAKVLRFLPASRMITKMGGTKDSRKVWMADNAETRALGTAAVMGRFLTVRMFRVALAELADLRSGTPTWVSRFSWRSPVFNAAVHCLDVPFFFDCLGSEKVEPLAGPVPPQELADTVHASALAFIKVGDPGWGTYGLATKQTRVFDSFTRTVTDGYASVRSLRSDAVL
ncbi:carboxylesterase family protein [Paeniglutamicibacter psychrophenolicus]|uniref:Carboxylic ester hydrolase n=1 Tax=Paeniglutamicibacter psychrophenolicus TaxID=257454 RepID=A0ABS4W9S4_9MICC|nr:carboxylesterase family protein [Paeniglutamicibacter psychrophenolicus]MBP2372940.1 para-nitrobenzyl esterase [Paeniglutamicibacter psychrophenolicus]